MDKENFKRIYENFNKTRNKFSFTNKGNILLKKTIKELPFRQLIKSGKKINFKCDIVLISVGRKPNIKKFKFRSNRC